MDENKGSMFDIQNNTGQFQQQPMQGNPSFGQLMQGNQSFGQPMQGDQSFGQFQQPNLEQQQAFNNQFNMQDNSQFNQNMNNDFNSNYSNTGSNKKPIIGLVCLGLVIVLCIVGISILKKIKANKVENEVISQIENLPEDVITDDSNSNAVSGENNDVVSDENIASSEESTDTTTETVTTGEDYTLKVGNTELYLPLDYFFNYDLTLDSENSTDNIVFFGNDRYKVQYSDSFISVEDKDGVNKNFYDIYYNESDDTYEWLKNSQEVNGKMIYYVASYMKDSTILNAYILQDLGLDNYVMIQITDYNNEDLNIPNLVNKFLIDVNKLTFR